MKKVWLSIILLLIFSALQAKLNYELVQSLTSLETESKEKNKKTNDKREYIEEDHLKKTISDISKLSPEQCIETCVNDKYIQMTESTVRCLKACPKE